jgi:hypothetical protein
MKTEVGRNWYQSINFDKLSCLASKYTKEKDAENVYAPLVMVPIGGRKRTLGVKRVHQMDRLTQILPALCFQKTLPLNKKYNLFCSLIQMT